MLLTNKKINFLSKGYIRIKNPLHNKSDEAASKQDGQVLTTIRYSFLADCSLEVKGKLYDPKLQTIFQRDALYLVLATS